MVQALELTSKYLMQHHKANVATPHSGPTISNPVSDVRKAQIQQEQIKRGYYRVSDLHNQTVNSDDIRLPLHPIFTFTQHLQRSDFLASFARCNTRLKFRRHGCHALHYLPGSPRSVPVK